MLTKIEFISHNSLCSKTVSVIHNFSDWDYYINLAGSEFPIHDVNEYVSEMKAKNISTSTTTLIEDSYRVWERQTYVFKESPTSR